MGCSGCSTGRGTDGIPKGCNNNGSCGTGGGCNKLNVFDWLANMQLPSNQKPFNIVEVRFKNDRKEFFVNEEDLALKQGDIVATEAATGHDIGTVSLTGELVKLQLQKYKVKIEGLLKLYRIAKPTDVEKWQEAIALEKPTMTQARKFAIDLGLEMKICDVEFQGDKTKATFYYTAEGRVDFRELIKVYASTFKIRIEMRQIGARQEASKLGGLGACGRELCCSSWLTDFRTVSTGAARYQQLSLNPQKLAGQCGKLKCCLNYELDSYLDAVRDFPDTNINLKTAEGFYKHFKTDIFKGIMWYVNTDDGYKMVAATTNRVKEVIEANKKGEKPAVLSDIVEKEEKVKEPTYQNVVGQDDLTRFDNKSKGNKNRPKNRPNFKKNKPKNNSSNNNM